MQTTVKVHYDTLILTMNTDIYSIHHLDRLSYFQNLLLDTCIAIHLTRNSASF